MKRFICVILLLAITLGLCACGGTGNTGEETTPAEGLKIGYARESILPEGPVNMSGGGNQAHRLSTGYLDILYATCLAITENGTTILLYSTDTLTAKGKWTTEARKLISEATGVPEANIQIGGTHTHSGPAVGGTEAPVLQWKPIYMDALVNSAKKAIADQAPTTLYGKKVQTQQMAFVRHYLMEDGSYAGANFGSFSKNIVEHATNADEEITLIKMEREGDKKDILLMNFQAHPCYASASNKNDLSADYIGACRDAVEKATGMQFIYFLGSTGNQNTNSKVYTEEGAHNADWISYGTKLAQYAIDALPTMTTPIQGSGVATTQENVEYTSNRYGQERLADATKVNDYFTQTGDSSGGNTMAKGLGFDSLRECTGIVACSKYPATGTIEFNACSFGGVGFVAAAYEMFSDSGLYIKKNSPFEFTIISTCTNSYNNYFPTEKAYAYGCYESYTARYDTGVAEMAAEKFVELLKKVQ